MVYIAPLPRGGQHQQKQQQKDSISGGAAAHVSAASTTTTAAAAAAADARQSDQRCGKSSRRHAAVSTNTRKHALARQGYAGGAPGSKSSKNGNRAVVGNAAVVSRWQERHSTTDEPAALMGEKSACVPPLAANDQASTCFLSLCVGCEHHDTFCPPLSVVRVALSSFLSLPGRPGQPRAAARARSAGDDAPQPAVTAAHAAI